MECTPRKKIRCGSEDHLISKYPKPPKDNQKWRKQVRLNEKSILACNNGNNNSDQNIYASMDRMSGIDERPSGNVGECLQLTNFILDSGPT